MNSTLRHNIMTSEMLDPLTFTLVVLCALHLATPTHAAHQLTLPTNFSMVYYTPSFHNFVQLNSEGAPTHNRGRTSKLPFSLSLSATSVLNSTFEPYSLTPDLSVKVDDSSCSSESSSVYYATDGAAGSFSGGLAETRYLWNFSVAGPLSPDFRWMNPLIMGDYVFLLDCVYDEQRQTPCNLRQLIKVTGVEISRIIYPINRSSVSFGGAIPSVICDDQFYLIRGNITSIDDPVNQLLFIEVWKFSADGMQLRDVVPLNQIGCPWNAADNLLSTSPDGRLLYAVVGPPPSYSEILQPTNIVVFDVDETGEVSHEPLSNLTLSGYVLRAVTLAPISGLAVVLRLSDLQVARDILVYSSDLSQLIWTAPVYGPYVYGYDGDSPAWPGRTDPKPVVGMMSDNSERLFVSHDNYTLAAYDLRTGDMLWLLGDGNCSVSGYSAPLILAIPTETLTMDGPAASPLVLVQGFCWPQGGSPYYNHTTRSVWLVNAESGIVYQEVDVSSGVTYSASHDSWAAPIQLTTRAVTSDGCITALLGVGDFAVCPLGELTLCVEGAGRRKSTIEAFEPQILSAH